MKTEPRWFVRYRMAWIAETLCVFGFINREHLMRKFGVSQPQASIDLKAFQRLHPHALYYDLSAKRYVVNNQDVRDCASRFHPGCSKCEVDDR